MKPGDIIEFDGVKWSIDRIEGDYLHLRRFFQGRWICTMVGKTVYEESKGK